MEDTTIDIDDVDDRGEPTGDDIEDTYEDNDNGKTEETFTKDFKEEIKNKSKTTNPHLTKYERTQLIGIRAAQLNGGAKPTVNVGNITNTVKIAEKELNERKLPSIVRRYMPDGSYEDWRVDELRILE